MTRDIPAVWKREYTVHDGSNTNSNAMVLLTTVSLCQSFT